jgi:prevent-host-death family protein
MPSVGLRDLGRSLSAIVREVRDTGEPTVITDRGRPVALISPIDEDDLEDFILANAPAFVAGRVAADDEFRRGETQSLKATLPKSRRSR